ncbi:MAG TPA: hypothetical protein VM733_06600 [Thermoanaerobaculia bacterium]|nr:hypothetical protein [Thermoanaerobaculia bacterium]
MSDGNRVIDAIIASMRIVMALMLALPLHAQVSGFALLRAATEDEAVTSQVQVGLDWRPSMTLGAHVHLLGRTNSDGSRRGHAGVVEAWLDQKLERGEHRFRFMEGAFFLPGTRENVDALWESPYTISSSALTSWLGEELRPIGVDASYTLRRRWTIGATAFRGNDTFGSLPAVRGWRRHDRWTLLGEHVPVNPEYYTSVSAENDGRIGWSARGRFQTDRTTLQAIHIDNRSDALEYGELANWLTRFDIASFDFTSGDWIFISEGGYGYTDIEVEGVRYRTKLRTAYVMASRRLGNARASLRAETYDHGRAVTAAYFFTRGKARLGAEARSDGRVVVEVRYYF